MITITEKIYKFLTNKSIYQLQKLHQKYKFDIINKIIESKKNNLWEYYYYKLDTPNIEFTPEDDSFPFMFK
jgi:hypothetical protein